MVIFLLLCSGAIPGQRSSVYRGSILYQHYEIPLSDLKAFRRVRTDLEESLLPYKVDGHSSRTYICNDTILRTTLEASGVPVVLAFQYADYSILKFVFGDYDGYIRYPKLSSFYGKVPPKHWRPIQRGKLKSTSFGFTHHLLHPYRQEYTTYVAVDSTSTYMEQFNYGGDFKVFFHPNGRVQYQARIKEDVVYLNRYMYIEDQAIAMCAELLESIGPVRESNESAYEDVLYEPDTSVDTSANFGRIDLSYVYDTTGQLLPFAKMPQVDYTYVELFTDDCGACDTQIDYLHALDSDSLYRDLGLVSIHVSDHDKVGRFLASVNERPHATWPVYMVPYGRVSFFNRGLKLSLLPRYLIVNSEGRIVLLNAPRPSDDRIHDVLKQLGL